MIARARNLAVAAAGAVMVAILAALALSGRSPGLPDLHFEPRGLVATGPSAVTAVEIRTSRERLGFRRKEGDAWGFDPSSAPVPPEVASHLELALHFMHVSQPTRSLDPGEYQGSSFADFGLDPPAFVVSLTQSDGPVVVADIGTLNPAGTAQYLRLVGLPTVHLMPRHVGTEWEITADMTRRLQPSAAGSGDGGAERERTWLLPASIDKVWAIEIAFRGKLHRLERDGAGDWFLHVGQHTHAGGQDAHVADPAQARVIAAALAALDQTQIETVVVRHPADADLENYGLSRPEVIALMYARDSSSPLARLAIGKASGDGFGRYARISGSDVVTVAAYKADGIVELLKAVGAAS